MRNTILIFIFLSSLYKGYSQKYEHFNYSKSEIHAKIVGHMPIDSVTTFEKIVLDGFQSKIPFYHFSNKRDTNNTYAILIHGLGGSKNFWVNPSMPYLEYTQNLTKIKDRLLEMGFNLIIVDARFHGERSYELNFRDPSILPPMRSRNVDDADLFYDLYVESIKEIRLIMDYFEKRTNKELQFNLVGYSMGGAFSLILNSIDERVHSVVACVPPIKRPYSEAEELNWPEEIKEKMKMISPFYVATQHKSPVAMLMGKSDFFIPEQEAKEFYNTIAITDKKIKFYDAGHELPKDYIEDVIQWINTHNKK